LTEETSTIEPAPCSTIMRPAARATQKLPRKLHVDRTLPGLDVDLECGLDRIGDAGTVEDAIDPTSTSTI